MGFGTMRFGRATAMLGAAALVWACERAADAPETTAAPEAATETAAEPGPAEAEAARTFAAVDDARLRDAAATPGEWLAYGGGYDEQRFSRLSQINRDTVGDLGVAWTYDLATSRGVEATPIVVDGVMYVTSAWSIVYALDAATGEELWVYDPHVSGEAAANGCCDVVNRGVAVYDGKVYVGVFDGRLEALDAATGEVVWSTVTVDQTKPYSITAAPRVVDGKVLIGNGGAELGVRGYLSAYDAETGDLVWRFYTAPNPEKAADGAASDAAFAGFANATWGDSGAWTTDGGGGTVWDAVIYDAVNDSVIFGVGNGSPWNAAVRDPDGDGDNLFLSSIVAVDADTGAYKWHFQTTPREQWDYTATQSLILADLPLGPNGAERRVVMQAPKNGFFYVLDAADGSFISGAPFTPMTWAIGLDANGRPIENPAARETDGGFLAIPAPHGAHNWHPMAFSPETGLAYIPAQVVPQLLQSNPDKDLDGLRWNIFYDIAAGTPPAYPPELLEQLRGANQGFLLAWDPVAQGARWSAPLPGPFNGGVLATASGLVFQGSMRGDFVAYDAATGEKLWSRNVNSGVAAGPSTYAIDGAQYVAVATGWGGVWALSAGYAWDEPVAPEVGRIVVFTLGGDGDIPEPTPPVAPTPKAAAFGDEAMVLAGLGHYADNCLVCHGPLAMSSGVLPDLRWSPVAADPAAWRAVVIDGVRADAGMVSFAPQLSAEEAEAVRAYVLSQAWLAVARGDAQAPEPTP